VRPTIRELLASGRPGEAVSAQGWVRSARHAKERSFLDLVDGSCLAGLQVVAEAELPNYEAELRRIGTGFAISARGELRASPAAGQALELAARAVEVIGAAGSDYPLQKKRHGFEFLRTLGHLRLRTNTLGAVQRVRNAAAMAIHEFFQARGFALLHAPIVTASDAEGAGALFRVTTLDPKSPPRREDGGVDFARDFFGREAFLTVSGQLEAEIAALALSRVYTFGPTFRAENSNTARHLAEFWMVEPEMAFCDLRGDMELAEEFLRHVIGRILERCPEELAFFRDRIDSQVVATLEHVAREPFEHLRYGEAIEILERSGRAFEFPVKWGRDLQSEHERFLAEEHVRRPVVVTDYPVEIKAFYMYLNDDERTVRAMDVLVPRVGEIIGGSQREHRLDVLRRRMRAAGLREDAYWWYLELRRHGSVPHAGFGLGFERLVQFATGMANIRDVIPFPRTPGSAEF
jgi:asparaginyl-tRNA synthetase